MRKQIDEESGGLQRNRRKLHTPRDDYEPAHTMRDQMHKFQVQAQVQPAQQQPLPSPGDLPEAQPQPQSEENQQPQPVRPAGKNKERPTVVQVNMDAPHGVLEIEGSSGGNSSTARIPLTAEERASFMAHSQEIQKVSLRKDKWGSVATIGASLLSFSALAVLLVGAASAIKGKNDAS